MIGAQGGVPPPSQIPFESDRVEFGFQFVIHSAVEWGILLSESKKQPEYTSRDMLRYRTVSRRPTLGMGFVRDISLIRYPSIFPISMNVFSVWYSRTIFCHVFYCLHVHGSGRGRSPSTIHATQISSQNLIKWINGTSHSQNLRDETYPITLCTGTTVETKYI